MAAVDDYRTGERMHIAYTTNLDKVYIVQEHEVPMVLSQADALVLLRLLSGFEKAVQQGSARFSRVH